MVDRGSRPPLLYLRAKRRANSHLLLLGDLAMIVTCFLLLLDAATAFSTTCRRSTTTASPRNVLGGHGEGLFHDRHDNKSEMDENLHLLQRRNVLQSSLLFLGLWTTTTTTPWAWAEQEETLFSPKFVQQYEDFTQAKEGWSYKDVRPGTGDAVVEQGDRVVYDWSGYTIGYFGRPFQAKNGPQGGAFDKDVDYERTVVGSGGVVQGLDSALRGMRKGQVRQVIVPFGPLSYPPSDLPHEQVGPKPTTFSGQRALNFVLENPRIDRTLLFNVKVIRIDKKQTGANKFVRGA